MADFRSGGTYRLGCSSKLDCGVFRVDGVEDVEPGLGFLGCAPTDDSDLDCAAHEELDGVFERPPLQDLRRRDNEAIVSSLDNLELATGDGDGSRLGHTDSVVQAIASVRMEGVLRPVG